MQTMAENTEVRLGDKIIDLQKAFPLNLNDAIALGEIGVLNPDGSARGGKQTLKQARDLLHHFLNKVDNTITPEITGTLELSQIQQASEALGVLMAKGNETGPLVGKKRR